MQKNRHPPYPARAALQRVHFEDRPEWGGLLLGYTDYRALQNNIMEYRREIKDLRDTLTYYR